MAEDYSPLSASGDIDFRVDDDALFRSCVDMMQDAVLIVDAGADSLGLIRYANAAFEILTGFTQAEIRGRSPDFLFGPETEGTTVTRARDAIARGNRFRGRITAYRKRGDSMVLDWRLSPTLHAHGDGRYWMVMLRDVSEEAAQLERLELTRKATGEGLWDWNCRTGALYLDDGFFRITGLDPQATPRQLHAIIDIFVPEDRDRVRTALEAHTRTQDPLDIEAEAFHADGRRIALALRGQAAWNDARQPTRLVGTIRDVSEHRSLRARMLDAERVAQIGHYAVDLEARRVAWSPQMYVIAGLDPERFEPDMDNTLSQYHPDDRQTIAGLMHDAIARGEPFAFDARIQRPDGRIRHVHASGQCRTNAAGRTTEIFGILQDRTDLVLKERQLEQAQRLQAFGQLAGGVAHDFNNLLAVIMGNAELLQDMAADRLTPEHRALLDEAIKAVLRGRTLTDSLLSFARVAPLRPEPLRVRTVFDEVERVLARTLPANIDLRVDIPDAPWPFYADEGNLKGALYNLALNARDAMPEGGTLTFTVTHTRLEAATPMPGDRTLAPGPYAVIAVSDTGSGIPPALHDRVFEPFFTTKPVGKGSGLGLARVRGFAEQSGGAAEIESVPGAGSTVRLFLPAYGIEDSVIDSPDIRRPTEEDGPGGLRVLLAEDMPEVRRMMRRMLEREGFSVRDAASGDAAKALYDAEPAIDLLVTDVVMPGRLQGPDLVRQLRAEDPDLPVIVVSGYAGEAWGQEGSRVPGAEPIRLMKPVSADDMRRALRRALDPEKPPLRRV